MSNPEDYTVGWICALTTEFNAAIFLLDKLHPDLSSCAEGDTNSYKLGEISGHKVVLAIMPVGKPGTTSAATTANHMLRTFPNLRICLMVGIGGGVPSDRNDIRLGDVVIGSPTNNGTGGVVQYDHGRAVHSQKHLKPSGHLNQPPEILLTHVGALGASYEREARSITKTVETALQGRSSRIQRKYTRPDAETDRLYRPGFAHEESDKTCTQSSSCFDADPSNLVPRRYRDEDEFPKVHGGLIASGNTLIKDATRRDELSSEWEGDILCFEMEAAGLMNNFPCLVIRGIADYADSHKNDEWHGYAAMVAAACAKDLLSEIKPVQVKDVLILKQQMDTIKEAVHEVKATVDEIHSGHKETEVKDWLKAPDPSTNFDKGSSLRSEGSGTWLLKEPRFIDWKAKEGRPFKFLWLHGIPGCGKSVLSSTVIDNLERCAGCEPLLYFFFDFSEKKKQGLRGLISSLVNQLYRKHPKSRTEFERFFNEEKQRNGCGTTASLKQLLACLTEMVKVVDQLWLVIDGLDECTERDYGGKHMHEGLLAWMKDFFSPGTSCNIHLLVTSRYLEDIRSSLEVWTDTKSWINIQSDLVSNDIGNFVRQSFAVGKGLDRWAGRIDVQLRVITELKEKANGMFRLAACQIDVIKDCVDEPSLDRVLKSLPKTLYETYDRMLKAISPGYRLKAIRVLQFVIYSTTPLRLDEVVDIIAVDLENEPPFRVQNRMPKPEDVLLFCVGFLMIQDRVEGTSPSSAVKYLQLAHLSVKEYFASGLCSIPDEAISNIHSQLSESKAGVVQTSVLLAYLLHAYRTCPGTALSDSSKRHEM
ncbi:purine and uridine phosphorylase [Ascobolus immersus RN42]|uniref:Purine and uridine phosphorylase n=1 Tax=Ascobolus immersus RN42 TaxID=1160509 RepID=A0A3N4HUV3_ASCIM|nr:purine and uridine phosphorylase [Ascobolus immersus RN42]